MDVYYFFVLLLSNKLIMITSELLHKEENLCDPNKSTQEECSLKFPKMKSNDENCEPNTFILVDCNVCRCGLDGKIDKTQCIKHKCNNDEMNTRRLNPTAVDRCKHTHWYQLSRCHLCYCVNEHTLICNDDNKQEKVQLGEYDLYDCGENLIKDLSKIIPPEDMPLRSVTKEVRSKTKKTFLKSKLLKLKSVDQTLTPKIIFLSPDKSLHPKSSEEIIEIKFMFNAKDKVSRGFMEDLFNNDEDISSLNINSKELNTDSSANSKPYRNLKTDTKSRGFIEDLVNYDEDTDITSLNINSIELNADSSTDLKAVGNSLLESDTTSEVYDDNVNNYATKSNIDLSNALDTLLSLAVRKSMVSIGSGNNCEPGSTVKKGCNSCFCLANGKLLCTIKICE
ncbi:uncharacterized protein [Maniola hyperantus]|uniref:uncharacterized protein n=1 Tax=Aphantopus hyperantus TaxID=2795564 RepID=UPI003749C4D7